MSELDQIYVENPFDEDYILRYNGEAYKLGPHEGRAMAQHLARHFAKHMSDKLCAEDFVKAKTKFEKNGKKMPDPLKTQITMFDSPERRIALFKCLRNKDEVLATLLAYPQFKAELTPEGKVYNLTGDPKKYEDFIESESEQNKETRKLSEPAKTESGAPVPPPRPSTSKTVNSPKDK